jgi:hypothetical protein
MPRGTFGKGAAEGRAESEKAIPSTMDKIRQQEQLVTSKKIPPFLFEQFTARFAQINETR